MAEESDPDLGMECGNRFVIHNHSHQSPKSSGFFAIVKVGKLEASPSAVVSRGSKQCCFFFYHKSYIRLFCVLNIVTVEVLQ